jgi:hypothetical protein
MALRQRAIVAPGRALLSPDRSGVYPSPPTPQCAGAAFIEGKNPQAPQSPGGFTLTFYGASVRPALRGLLLRPTARIATSPAVNCKAAAKPIAFTFTTNEPVETHIICGVQSRPRTCRSTFIHTHSLLLTGKRGESATKAIWKRATSTTIGSPTPWLPRQRLPSPLVYGCSACGIAYDSGTKIWRKHLGAGYAG